LLRAYGRRLWLGCGFGPRRAHSFEVDGTTITIGRAEADLQDTNATM